MGTTTSSQSTSQDVSSGDHKFIGPTSYTLEQQSAICAQVEGSMDFDPTGSWYTSCMELPQAQFAAFANTAQGCAYTKCPIADQKCIQQCVYNGMDAIGSIPASRSEGFAYRRQDSTGQLVMWLLLLVLLAVVIWMCTKK